MNKDREGGKPLHWYANISHRAALHYTLYTIHYKLEHNTLYTIHNTPSHYTLYTVHSTLYTLTLHFTTIQGMYKEVSTETVHIFKWIQEMLSLS